MRTSNLFIVLFLLFSIGISGQSVIGGKSQVGGISAVSAGTSGGGGGGGTQTPVFKTFIDSACSAGAATTCNAASAMNVATGDFIVAFAGSGDTGNNTIPTITSVACTTGSANAMTIPAVTAASSSAAPGKITMGYISNATANATCTWQATGASQAFRTIVVANYGNMAATGVLDQGPVCNVAGCNTGSTGTATRTAANTSTTTQAKELGVCGEYEDQTSSFAAGTNFTIRSATSTDHAFTDDIMSATQVFPNGNFLTSGNTSSNYVSLCATFKSGP